MNVSITTTRESTPEAWSMPLLSEGGVGMETGMGRVARDWH